MSRNVYDFWVSSVCVGVSAWCGLGWGVEEICWLIPLYVFFKLLSLFFPSLLNFVKKIS